MDFAANIPLRGFLPDVLQMGRIYDAHSENAVRPYSDTYAHTLSPTLMTLTRGPSLSKPRARAASSEMKTVDATTRLIII